MSDYINRAVVMERTVKRNSIWNKVTNASGQGLEEIINEIPSEDVEPVRHGKWEATEWAVNSSGEILIGRIYRCSECGRIIDLEHGETLDDYPYCHCGAKMDGEVIKNE